MTSSAERCRPPRGDSFPGWPGWPRRWRWTGGRRNPRSLCRRPGDGSS
jgi:hypothetical protein